LSTFEAQFSSVSSLIYIAFREDCLIRYPSTQLAQYGRKGFLIGVLQKVQRVFTKEAFEKGNLLGAGQDGNREWITVLATICMDGTFLPPALIYQAVSGNVQDTWLDDFNPEEQSASFASSPSGWTNDILGLSWLQTVDTHTKQKARNGRD